MAKIQSKQSISTGAMFKKPLKGLGRAGKTGQRKPAVEEASKVHKSNKQHKIKQLPEHALSAAFTDSIEQSRDYIFEKVTTSYGLAYMGLAQRLTSSQERFNQEEQALINYRKNLSVPFKDGKLEWSSFDSKQSGTTVLSTRMKKFQKIIDVEEKELARHFEEWVEVQAEIDSVAAEVAAPDELERMAADNPDNGAIADTGDYLSADQVEMMEEIKAEKARFGELMEQAAKASMREMKASEKELKLKQKKVEASFMAMLRDVEY